MKYCAFKALISPYIKLLYVGLNKLKKESAAKGGLNGRTGGNKIKVQIDCEVDSYS